MTFEYGTMNICIVLGIKSIDTWFGTLYFVYGLGLETPNLISC